MVSKLYTSYPLCFFVLAIVGLCNGHEPNKTHSSHVIVVFGESQNIVDLRNVTYDTLIFKNVGRNSINFSIESQDNDEIFYKNVVNNVSTVRINRSELKSFNVSVLRLENNVDEAVTVHITIWQSQPNDDNNNASMCEKLTTSELPQYSLKHGKKVNYQFLLDDIYNETVKRFDFDAKRVLFDELKTKFIDLQKVLNKTAEMVRENSINHIVSWTVNNETEVMVRYNSTNHTVSWMIDNKTGDVVRNNLTNHTISLMINNETNIYNETNNNNTMINQTLFEETLKQRRNIAVSMYKDLFNFAKNDTKLFKHDSMKTPQIALSLINNFMNLKLKIYNIGLIQMNMSQETRRKLQAVNIEIPYLETEEDKQFLNEIKDAFYNTVKNYNDFVVDLIDNLYTYAYQDSVIDQEIYNAVVRMHNCIMDFGIRPVHYIIDKYFNQYNLTVDFIVADFPRPYLQFSKLFGEITLDSNVRAYSLIDELYNQNETSNNDSTIINVFYNSNGDLVGIDNHKNATNVTMSRLEITPDTYVSQAEVCLESMIHDNATIVRSLKLYYSNDSSTEILTSNNTKLYCKTYGLRDYSIYRLNVFSHGCDYDGVAASVAFIYKALNNFNIF